MGIYHLYHIYHRYPSGAVEYLGPEEWSSLEDLLEYSQRADRRPETEQMVGWKHDAVVWYGDIGIGEEN